MIDVRFPTALQIMLSLALAQAEGFARLSSSQLAEGVDSNPTFVRKLLTPLISAGLVASAAGRGGGVSLARSPGDITLAAIYDASVGAGPLWPARTNIPHRCLVSCNFDAFFSGLAGAAGRAVWEELASQTLADALVNLRSLESARAAHSAHCEEKPVAVADNR